ncbi:MAG: O-antigen ligase family protein [Gemmatimonadales bacterium]
MGVAPPPLARVAVASPPRPGLAWGLQAFIWLLPFHVLLIAVLFSGFGLPTIAVRAIAAWKETTVALLVALTLLNTVAGRTARTPVQATDLTVGALGLLALTYLIGATAWFAADLPTGLQLLGWRDAVFFTLLYFVGRATPQVAQDSRYLGALFGVGVITSALAILERIFVTPQMLVLLGAGRYIQEFLGLAPATRNNEYGLPDNYWTVIGDHVVRRTGSAYLSSQGFAVPFLLLLPAATLWLLSSERRRTPLAWAGYAVLWTGLLLSVTRMTTVVCVLQVLLLAVAWRRWGPAVGAGLVGLIGLGVALLLVPDLATFVWETLTWRTGSSVAHLEDWSEGIQSLMAHPLGVGLGAGGLTAARFGLPPTAADSQYFKYSVELGVPGLLLYVGILVALGAAGLRAFLRAPADPQRCAGALLLVAAIGIALNGLTTAPLTSPPVSYVFFWIGGAVATVAGRSSNAAAGVR